MFAREKHIQFLANHLRCLPEPYTSLDSNRMMMVHFCIGGLAMLHALDDDTKAKTISWLRFQQAISEKPSTDYFRQLLPVSGFEKRPSSTQTTSFTRQHVALEYSLLAALQMLMNDKISVNDTDHFASAHNRQHSDGSFFGDELEGIRDLRYLYCTFAVASMIGNWGKINKNKALDYIKSCWTYEGAFGLRPGMEAHGGSTFCAVASLAMCGELRQIPSRDRLIYWLVRRQNKGFQGRTNKPADTCYSFWAGCSLRILNGLDLVDSDAVTNFLLECQGSRGGFSKDVTSPCDVIHTFLTLCWFSLLEMHNLSEINPLIAVVQPAMSVSHSRGR